MAENWVATTESNMVVVMAILSDFERAFLLAIGSVVRWVASMESHSAQLRDLVTAVWMALKTGMSLAEDWEFDWDVWSVASMAVSRVDKKVCQ